MIRKIVLTFLLRQILRQLTDQELATVLDCVYQKQDARKYPWYTKRGVSLLFHKGILHPWLNKAFDTVFDERIPSMPDIDLTDIT